MATQTKARRKKKKKLNYKGLILCAVLLFLVLIIPISSASNSYKSVMKTYCKSIVKQDYQKYKSAFPTFMVENGLEDLVLFTYDTTENFMETQYNSYTDVYGKGLKISYKINDRTKLSKEELAEYTKSANELSTDGESIKFKKGYTLNVTMKYKGKLTSSEEEISVVVVKCNGDWYIYGGDLYFC
jgi:CRISPR/Cas system CMR-associated protein Cmr5 small subunit